MRTLLRSLDALFGPAAPGRPLGRTGVARYLLIAAGLALVVVARRPDAILRPQFWAEDGTVFFAEQLRLGFWPALRTLYGGLPFLVPRLIAALASPLPTARVPLAYSASAVAITGLAVATFALPGFRHLVRSDATRVAACVALVCLPAGAELLATPTTLGYFLALALVLLSVMRTPRTTIATATWCAAGVLAALSTTLAPVAAPFWLLRIFRGVARRTAGDVAFGTTLLLTLLATMATVAAAGTRLASGVEAYDTAPGGLRDALRVLAWTIAACTDAALVPPAVFRRLEARGTLAIVAPATLAAFGVALACGTLARRGRVTVGLALYVLAASLGLILSGRHLIAVVLERGLPAHVSVLQLLGPRHRALPNAALVLLVAGLVDGAPARRVRTVATAVAAGAFLWTWAPEFRVPPAPDLQWPVWARRLDQKLASRSPEPLVIPSNPPFFEIRIDAPPR